MGYSNKRERFKLNEWLNGPSNCIFENKYIIYNIIIWLIFIIINKYAIERLIVNLYNMNSIH